MTSCAKRRVSRAAAVIVAAACVLGAAASVAGGDPPGNNGTVKIDFATGPITRANHPHPGCPFRISGFGFDANQAFNLSITPQGGPNVAGSGTLADTFSATAQGTFVRGPYDSLAAGMYKLDLGTHQGGGNKFKVFRIPECALAAEVTTPTTTPGQQQAVTASRAAGAVSTQPRTAG